MVKKIVQEGKEERARNWSFILYEESAVPEWRDILDEEHVPWIESPVHDKDFNPDNTPKKAHKHILLLYAGKKSYKQVETLTSRLNATIPQRVKNTKGLVRYFAHIDNPEKAQYPVTDIVAHNGADAQPYLKATATARYELIAEMIDFCTANDIRELDELIIYARHERLGDWFPLLCDNSAFVMNAFIRSRRHRLRDEEMRLK